MKNTFRTIISLSIIAVFVILNWATSQDIDYRELNAEAIIFQDTLIILKNVDALDIVDAELNLSAPETENFEQYSIQTYSLASNSSDTIPMIDFVNESNIMYPDSIAPSNLSLFFIISENTGESTVSFSTDL